MKIYKVVVYRPFASEKLFTDTKEMDKYLLSVYMLKMQNVLKAVAPNHPGGYTLKTGTLKDRSGGISDFCRPRRKTPLYHKMAEHCEAVAEPLKISITSYDEPMLG